MTDDLDRLTALECVRRLRAGELTPLDLIDAVERRAASGQRRRQRAGDAVRGARPRPCAAADGAAAGRGRAARRPAGRGQGLDDGRGRAHDPGSPIFADNVPKGRTSWWKRSRSMAASWWQDEHAGVRGRRQYLQRGVRGDAQSLEPRLKVGGSSGGSAAALAAGSRARHRLRPRRLPAHAGQLLLGRRVPAQPRPGRPRAVERPFSALSVGGLWPARWATSR